MLTNKIMGFVQYNANPDKNLVTDCTVRAISILLDQSWDETYIELCLQGFKMKNMPNANSVWGAFLKRRGFIQETIPGTCPDCYSVRQFVRDYPYGIYMLATGNHVIPVIDGNYYDTWDSGDEVPIYFWRKGE